MPFTAFFIQCLKNTGFGMSLSYVSSVTEKVVCKSALCFTLGKV